MTAGGTPDPETGRTIDAAAQQWAVRLDAGLTDSERDDLEAWLAADARRVGALARAEAIMAWSAQARVLSAEHLPVPEAAPDASLSRRRFLAWGGGMAAAVGGGLTVYGTMTRRTLYQTQKGEVRLIPLADGVTATLNTQTRLSIPTSAHGHAGVLEVGEAFFQIAAAARPFVLTIGAALVRVGTAGFAASLLDGDPIRIAVRRGAVDIFRFGDHISPPLRADADTEVLLPQNPSASAIVRAVSAERAGDAFEWLEGKIVLQGTSLREAARQFYRYSDMRIVIADARLAQAPITGLFAANDPVGFCSAVASVLGAGMKVSGQTIILSASR